jgi:hypothetical protein
MLSFGMLRCVALVRAETSVLTIRVTRRNIPEDGILYSHRRENLKFYYTLRGRGEVVTCPGCKISEQSDHRWR